MRGEKASPAASFCLHEPAQGVAHDLFTVTAASLKQLGTVSVCGVLGVPAVRPRDKKIGR